MSTTAQHPHGADRFVGRHVTFDLPDGGKRVGGFIISAKENGVRGEGKIPDFILEIRGKSGRVVSVSMFDAYAVVSD